MHKCWYISAFPLLCLVPGAVADKLETNAVVPQLVVEETKNKKAQEVPRIEGNLGLKNADTKINDAGKLNVRNSNTPALLTGNTQLESEAIPLVTPEPTTLLLVGGGLAGIVLASRRKKSKLNTAAEP